MPTRPATAATVRSVVSSSRRAASTRSPSTNAAGVVPVSRRKRACERARAHAGPCRRARRRRGSRRDGRRATPAARRSRSSGALGAELGAELRLTAGALHEHDEPSRRLVRDLGTVVCLHQREEQVDTGGHTRRGPPVAVVDVDAVGEDSHAGMAGGEHVTRSPVCRRLVAVEQTGLGEEQRRRCTPTRSAAPAVQSPRGRPGIAGRVRADRVPSPPTTTSVSIRSRDRRQRRQRHVGGDRHAAVRADRLAVRRRDRGAV